MAEGWVRALKGGTIEAFSAGTDTRPIDRRAVAVMDEKGIGISDQCPKHVSGLLHIDIDFVVTLCDHARDAYPAFPGKAKIVHRAFEDPPFLARAAATEAEALEQYRRVRDEIREFVESFPESLSEEQGG
jgi:arsenate reductase